MNPVPDTILQQLGGRRFIAMTGARNLVGSERSLSFRIGGNRARISGLHIELTPSDTYTVTFLRIRCGMPQEVSRCEDVYAEDLQHIFTATTGMDTHL